MGALRRMVYWGEGTTEALWRIVYWGADTYGGSEEDSTLGLEYLVRL